ncbi:MAG: methyltransferase domain-containing protein [Thermoanaerobaculia bacterium]|nr:methyltransferase domain-containing protein [Thermoanaerobaculia bacterium]
MPRSDPDKLDFTADLDYERLIKEEVEHYRVVDVTEDLRESTCHGWDYYWQKIGRELSRHPSVALAANLNDLSEREGRDVKILSLGSGYCGHEIALARQLTCGYELVCTDINEGCFHQARSVARSSGLAFTFEVADLNFLDIEPNRFDLIVAHASLHHVINLERLLGSVALGLTPSGVFHVVEVVGQNRRLIWPENEHYAQALLKLLPTDVTGGTPLEIFEIDEGMEGIRQEVIDPLLGELFRPIFECRHGAFIRFICTHEVLGPRLSPERPESLRCLDFLIEADRLAVRHGFLRPLELWGVYRPR